ncbi:hypothetical protein B7494_g1075 [Chlorociboria aeruginascens]|nr:hypothetical protein B7494_g1075 [Chlorociboria aeruginascens]
MVEPTPPQIHLPDECYSLGRDGAHEDGHSSASDEEYQHALEVVFDQENSHRRKSSLVSAHDTPAVHSERRRNTECYVHSLLESFRRNGRVPNIGLEEIAKTMAARRKAEEENDEKDSPVEPKSSHTQGGDIAAEDLQVGLKGDEEHAAANSRLLTKRQLSDMAWGVRELSKRLGGIRLKLKVKTVFLLTKAHDEGLIINTREVAKWLLSPDREVKYTVWVEDNLRDNKKFDSKGLLEELKKMSPNECDGRLRYWNNDICKNRPHTFDFIITLGGDGTVLYASWLFQRVVPPVMSFALGSLGFLTKFDYEQFEDLLTKAFTDGVKISLRLRFEGTVMRSQKKKIEDGKEEEDESMRDLVEELVGEEKEDERTHRPDVTYEILNDIVVDRGPNPIMSSTEIFGDDEHFTTVQADGICVATPTGSTAYNLAAGGSLCHPENPVILLTAICAHTLSFRPIILPDTIVLRIGVPYDARASSWASFDGRERVELRPGDYVTISASRYPFANQEQREHLSSLPSDLTGTLSTSTILPTSQHPKGGESRQGSVATESHAGPSTITNPTSTIKRSNASGAAPPYPLSNPPPTNSTTLPGPNIQVTSPTRWSLRNALIGAGNSDTHASPFRSRAATGASIGSYRLRRPSAARLWNPTNSTPRISPGQQKPRSRRRPRSSAEERPVIAVPLSHPDIDKPREGANAGGEYPLLTLPEQRQSRHLGSTRGSLQVERTGSPSGSNRISLPRSVSIDLQRKKSESPTSPALDKGKGRAIDDDDPPLETRTTILRVPSRSSGSQPPTPRIIIGFDSDKGKGKETMADLERGPETQIPYAPGGNSSIPNPNNASHASLQSGLGPALSQTNSSIEGEEINAEEEWGPHHPCFPHMNPHVPLSSSLYQTTRIIRINRDWMIEGDLAPTFSNLYPEILDPAGVSEQEFRRIIEKVNSELIPAHNPWSLRNIFDGFMGVMTGWIWDDLGLTDVKGRLRKVEAFLEDWNQEMERKSRESGMAPKILDIQVPDPEISYPASGTEEERTNTGASHTSGQHPQ